MHVADWVTSAEPRCRKGVANVHAMPTLLRNAAARRWEASKDQLDPEAHSLAVWRCVMSGPLVATG